MKFLARWDRWSGPDHEVCETNSGIYTFWEKCANLSFSLHNYRNIFLVFLLSDNTQNPHKSQKTCPILSHMPPTCTAPPPSAYGKGKGLVLYGFLWISGADRAKKIWSDFWKKSSKYQPIMYYLPCNKNRSNWNENSQTLHQCDDRTQKA